MHGTICFGWEAEFYFLAYILIAKFINCKIYCVVMTWGELFEVIDRIQDVITLFAVPVAVYLLYRIYNKIMNQHG